MIQPAVRSWGDGDRQGEARVNMSGFLVCDLTTWEGDS